MHLFLSVPTLLLYFMSPLEPTPISLALNIASLTAQVTSIVKTPNCYSAEFRVESEAVSILS